MKVKVTQRDSFEVIMSAVNKTVNLIKPTYGPASNKVIISKVTHAIVVDDGVQIARDLELEDPNENAVMKVVRETAIKTNDRVGDGTTGSLIILQAIMQEVEKMTVRNGRKIEKELKAGFEEAKAQLLSEAKAVTTLEELTKVARVSFDDETIAKEIAEAWHKLGKDGILAVDRSDTMETTLEMKEGININRGYISPYMVTNPERMEAVLEKPYILFTDFRLTEANDVIGIMEKLMAKKIISLVIVAENVEQSALSTLIVNKMQGKFITIAVNAPAGDEKTQALEDMAIMCGGKVYSEAKGDKLEEVEIEDLGRADKFVAKRDESTIIGPKGNFANIVKAINDIKKARKIETNERIRETMLKRIARFGNKVGVIKVGAATENETKALKYKVEDAVNATRSAFQGGVVAGGGVGLANIKTSSDLLNNALQVPFKQLMANMGILDNQPLEKGKALNVVTGDIGPWEEIGVMDPTEVLIAQIEGAVSIASLLVTTSGLLVEDPEYLKREEN